MESEEQLRLLFDNAPIGIVYATIDGRFLRVNQAFCDTVGYTANELQTRMLADVTHPDDVTAIRTLIEKAVRGETATLQTEKRCLHKSGRIINVIIQISLLRDAEGQPNYLIIQVVDITEHKRTKELMYQRQKIESLGVLAGGVAHDFNNLLTAIMGQSSLALLKLPPGSPGRPHIEKAINAAERAADLAHQMLAYSGRGHFVKRPTHLNLLIQDNLRLFQASIPKQIQLRLELADSLPPIEADVGQIQQVIMNLIINGAEAIGERPGTVVVETGKVELSNEDSRLHKHTGELLPPGGYVRLTVRDDGCGMDEETASKIFDPFFTTKFTGRGLGLAAVLGIVQGHRGKIRVRSAVGDGTTFQLFFPVSMAKLAVAAVPEVVHATKRQPGLILIIDDEASLREALTEIFELESIQVITAPDGATGISLYRERAAAIDLILLDLSMPGLSGEDTLRALRQINPDVKVILSSGYNAAEVIPRFAGKGLTGFIQKPYRADTLVQEVRAYMGSGQ